jgi:REP element-mobilizing transposase RayT
LTRGRGARSLEDTARPLRIEQADGFYHVLNRGNERQAIFADDRDREGLLARLGRCVERFELDVFAYVLMGNHYHLLLRTRRANLSAAMQWLGVSYSVAYNRRHGRCGHLFQGRFKSFLIQEETPLRQLQAGAGVEERIVACRRLLDMGEPEHQALRQPARRAVRPRRDLLIYLLWRSGGLPLAAIGEHFHIGYPAVSMAKTRAQAYLKANKRLQRQLRIII